MKTFILLLALLFQTNAFALRCNNNLVYIGDSAFQVISKCGSPINQDNQGGVQSDISTMVYENGGGKETLTFIHGRLESIQFNRQ